MGFFRKILGDNSTKGKKKTNQTQGPVFYRTCLKCHHSNPNGVLECSLCGAKLDVLPQGSVKRIQHQLKTDDRIRELINGLKSTHFKTRDKNINALKKIGEPAIQPLTVALKDSDVFLQIGAAIALARLSEIRAVEPLVAILKKSYPKAKLHAAIALGEIGDAQAVYPLITALKDSDRQVRAHAAKALGKIGASSDFSREALINVLKDPDSNVRLQAVIALGKVGNKTVIDPLIRMLKDLDREIQDQAAKYLLRLEPYWDDWQRVEIAMTTEKPELASKVGSAGIEALIVALNDTDWGPTAVKALGMIGGAQIIDPLIHALHASKSEDVRTQAVNILSRTGNSKVVPPLIASLKDASIKVREQAVLAVGRFKDRRVVDPLISALKDKDSTVRGQAAQVLGEIGDTRAVQPLLSMLKDYDRRVRTRASDALSALGQQVLPPNWPSYNYPLNGNKVVEVRNVQNFKVRVGVRSGNSGTDFVVQPLQTGKAYVPSGTYQVYFQYSTDPLQMRKGNDILVSPDIVGVQIDIVSSPSGNYNIRPV